MEHFPAENLTIVLLDNCTAATVARLGTQLARVALRVSLPEVHDLPVPAAERAGYIGDYSLGPYTVSVWEEGERLMARAPGRGNFRLLSQGQHLFIASYDENVQFEFQFSGDRATGFSVRANGMATNATRAREPRAGVLLPR